MEGESLLTIFHFTTKSYWLLFISDQEKICHKILKEKHYMIDETGMVSTSDGSKRMSKNIRNLWATGEGCDQSINRLQMFVRMLTSMLFSLEGPVRTCLA